MRIVFMGSPEEVVAPLHSLFEKGPSIGLHLVGVVSQPARPVGRGAKLLDPPVAMFAKQNNLKCMQPESARAADFLAELSELKPDVIVTAAYGQILSDQFLAIPAVGTINIHPSRLPQYRGATPVPAALLDGLNNTAVSILFTVKKLDAGDLILQKDFDIGEYETSGELTKRLFGESSEMLLECLLKLKENPQFKGIPQDSEKATFCKKIEKEMGQVDWSQNASTIINRFRAFEPWPGTWTTHGDRRLALTVLRKHGGKFSFSSTALCGSFQFDKASKALVVKTEEGMVEVLRLKPAGGKDMDAPSFWNGLKDKTKLQFVRVES